MNTIREIRNHASEFLRRERHRIAVALPVVFVLAGSIILMVFAKHARGPSWLSFNLDPDYCYLLNSLNMAELRSVGHYDHPGTPMQVIGAVVLKVAHWAGGGATALERDVLGRPEFYLQSMFMTIMALIFAALCVMTRRFYQATACVGATIVVAAMIFCSPSLLVEITRVNPEPLLVFPVLLLQIALIGQIKPSPAKRDYLWFGAIVGFGVAVKVTFLPLAIIPFIVLQGWRKRISYCVCAALFLVVFTLPVADHYREMRLWLVGLLTHTGRYGTGSSGWIVVPAYIKGIRGLFAAEPIFAITLCAGMLYPLIIVASPELRRRSTGVLLRIIVACSVGQAAQILIAAKSPEPRYFVPSLSLIAFNAGCMIAHAYSLGVRSQKWASVGAGAYLAVLFALLPRQADAINALLKKHQDARHIATLAHDPSKKAVNVYYYAASSIPYALSFGNRFAGERYGRLLTEVYGPAYIYNPWRGTHQNFEKTVPLSEIINAGDGTIIYQGYSFETVLQALGGQPPESRPEKIAEFSGEAVYRIKASQSQ